MLAAGVGPAVATKVLHRKRRDFIPMLDSVVLLFYLDALGSRKSMEWRLFDKPRAIEATMPVWRQFRDDLRAVSADVDRVRHVAQDNSWHLSRVRTLEVLIWMEAEPIGYYRGQAAPPAPAT